MTPSKVRARPLYCSSPVSARRSPLNSNPRTVATRSAASSNGASRARKISSLSAITAPTERKSTENPGLPHVEVRRVRTDQRLEGMSAYSRQVRRDQRVEVMYQQHRHIGTCRGESVE